MPRISEPTVAEHRAARERALLDAAHAILLETGEAPGLAEVAARTHLARTSVYQYFGSRQELLRAMVRDVYPRWMQRVDEAMADAPTRADRILAYAVANVELVAEGAHAVGGALAALEPTDAVDQDAARMHAELQQPLVANLAELGVESPAEVAGLVTSVVHAATLSISPDGGVDQALRHLAAVLGPMIRELGGRGSVDGLLRGATDSTSDVSS